MLSPRSAAAPIQAEESASIAIIDDDDLVRMSTRKLLESAGYRVHCYSSGETFLRTPMPDRLGCALLDMHMPGRNGLEILRALADRDDGPSVLVLTGHGDIAAAVQAMKLGASDFMEKPYAADALLKAVDNALQQHGEARAAQEDSRKAIASVESLSERQRQVLAGMTRGQLNKTIAHEFGLSVRTVEAYRAQLMDKLGVRSTAGAVRIAIAAGMAVN